MTSLPRRVQDAVGRWARRPVTAGGRPATAAVVLRRTVAKARVQLSAPTLPTETIDKVIAALTTDLMTLNSVEASAWSVRAQALGPLGRREEEQEAYARAAALFDLTSSVAEDCNPEEIADISRALSAVGRNDDAETLLRRGLTATPGSAVLLEPLALQRELGGDNAAASEILSKLATMLATVDLDKAIDCMRRAVNLSPRESRYRGQLGRLLLRHGETEAAAEELESALEGSPDDGSLVTTLAEVKEGQGDVAEALNLLDTALERGLSSAELRHARGRLLLGRSRFSEALADLEAAAEFDHDNRDLLADTGITRVRLGCFREGLSALDRALELGVATESAQQAARVHTWRSWALHKIARPDAARDAIDAALRADPKNSTALIVLGKTMYEDNHLPQAVETFHQAASAAREEKSSNNEATALEWAADSYRVLGAYEDALNDLDAALLIRPQSGFALATRGQVLMSLGRFNDAVKSLEAGIQADGTLDWAYTELGECLRRNGDLPKAIGVLDEAVRRAPTSAYALGTRGQVYLALRQPVEAFSDLVSAAGMQPSRWIVEDLLVASGELPDERATLTEALAGFSGSATTGPHHLTSCPSKRGYFAVWINRDPHCCALISTSECSRVTRLPRRLRVGYFSISAELKSPRSSRVTSSNKRMATVSASSAYRSFVGARSLLGHVGRTNAELTRTPAYAEFRILKGRLLLNYRRYAEAERHCRSLLDDGEPAAIGLLGCCLCRMERRDEGITFLRQALDTAPNQLWLHCELGDALSLTGDQEGVNAYTRVVRLVDEGIVADAASLAYEGWCLYRLHRYDDAIQRIQRTLTTHPHWKSARFGLGLALLRADRGVLALDEYEGNIRQVERLRDSERAVGLITEALFDLEHMTNDDLPQAEIPSRQAAIVALQRAYERIKERNATVPEAQSC